MASGMSDGDQEMFEEIPSEGRAQGTSPVLKLLVPASDFNVACQWFESHTLVRYFLGRIPNDSMLRTWVQQVWGPYGIKVENVYNLTKDFFLFHFPEVSQA